MQEDYSSYKVGLPENLTENLSYQALILRSETPVYADCAGYADFYVREGSHVSVGTSVASVDEVGVYSETVREARKEQSLTKGDLERLKSQLKTLSSGYDPLNFSLVYETKGNIDAYFMNSVSTAAFAGLEKSSSAAEFFHIYRSGSSGVAAYYLDGYEKTEPKNLTAADFSAKNYNRRGAENLVTKGDFLYKVITSENWSLLFPVTAEEAALYGQSTSLNFTFLQNGLSLKAASSVLTGADGSYFVKLDLDRYMVQFASERYTRIRVSRSAEKGFKIPRSAVVSENFYMIPRGFESDSGFIFMDYSGSMTNPVVISPKVYFRDEQYCYVSVQDLDNGMVLAKPESDDRYTVRLTSLLDGVYEINKGYTVFCPIEILDESDDYLLIRRNTTNGVAAYDTLLLDARGYTMGQLLQQ